MRNPFYIEGPASIGVSAGETSGYLYYQILEAHDGVLPPDVHPHFQNTGEEDERALRFLHEMETRWSSPVAWLEWYDQFDINNYKKKDGTLSERRKPYSWPDDPGFRIVSYETAAREGEPFDAMLAYYAEYKEKIKGEPPILPTPADRMCTAHLKIKIMERYMRSLGYEEWEGLVGIRADEPLRIAKMREANQSGKNRWEGVMPLVEAGIKKSNVVAFWEKQPFRLEIKGYEGNCKLCILKSTEKLYTLIRSGRDDLGIERWKAREQMAGTTFRRDRPDYVSLEARAPFICTQCWTKYALPDKDICQSCFQTQGRLFDTSCAVNDELADCYCGG